MKDIKLLCSFILLLGLEFPVHAQTAFLPLPFDIEIGVTSNEVIENRGTCLERIQVSEYYFRCAKYSIQDRFSVYSSQNEFVTKLEFLSTAGHSLPRDWTAAGLKMGPFQREGYDGLGFYSYFTKNCEAGTSAAELIRMLEANNIAYEVTENKAETNLWIDKECLISTPTYQDVKKRDPGLSTTQDNLAIVDGYTGDDRKKTNFVTIKEFQFSVNERLYLVKTAQWYHNFSLMFYRIPVETSYLSANSFQWFQKDLGILEISVTEDY